MDLYLFRIKVLKPAEPELFASDATAPQLLRQMVVSKPTARRYRKQAWHIGNVQEVDRDGLYCALGRTARSTQPVLDAATGNFAETQFDTAPYTHVLLDVRDEVAAIARKTLLAPDAETLAHQFQRTLKNSTTAIEQRLDIEVAPIRDPDAFLTALRSAFAIKSFTVSFTKPNPLDVNRLFIAPMEAMAREANADHGLATLRGWSLNEEPLEDLSRSAAATGDDARARLQFEEGQRPVSRSLSGDTVSIAEDDLDSPAGRASGLARLRAAFRRIRSGASHEAG